MSDTAEIQEASLLCAECVRGREELGSRVPIEFMLRAEIPCEGCGVLLTRATAHSAYIGKTRRVEGKVVGKSGGRQIIMVEMRSATPVLKTKFTLEGEG
jgi:hypothetical protein